MATSLRARALRLLARREHARGELARKLSARAESAEDIVILLDDLAARGLLSEERYVEARLHARSARFGNARLASELRQQGVSPALVDAALNACDDEVTRAQDVWRRKFGDKAAASDPTERSRQMRFLLSRGFSGETIRRVMRGDFEDD